MEYESEQEMRMAWTNGNIDSSLKRRVELTKCNDRLDMRIEGEEIKTVHGKEQIVIKRYSEAALHSKE